jgi:hypothetical protein
MAMSYPEDGTVLMIAPSGVVKGTRNPNAAHLFLEFLLGKRAKEGVAGGPASDQAVPAINCDVVLVVEGRNCEIDLRRAILARPGFGELYRPAGIAVLLAQLRGLFRPAFRNLPSLDHCPLRLGVALPRRGDDDRVHDLSTHR